MQDKESVDDAEEALTCKTETAGDRRTSFENSTSEKEPSDTKESSSGKKESTKDGKFAFRRMRQPKKEKPAKNSPSRFEGEGVVFKAKLIGVEAVSDARGDKMCQEAMQKLKQNVKNAGPHKKKINVCVSLQGIKIKDEKNVNVIYHHPVNLISFISQDITDARAFGYVFGSTEEPHQFIAIKTEKPAFHVVVAIRDLFQTVLNFKKEEIDIVKESKNECQKTVETESKTKKVEEEEANKILEEHRAREENIYFEVLLTEPLKMKEEEETVKVKESEPVQTVDDLLGLQDELTKLQEGIAQMDTSIASAAAFNSDVAFPEADPFDTSFVLGPKRDSIPFPMPTPIPLASTVTSNEFGSTSNPDDKYAVFSVIDSTPSVFETVPAEAELVEQNDANDMNEHEERRKSPPAKPPRNSSKSSTTDLSIFADLDPLGKDRPYKDKTEFFQDVKNPPKKVLNDLVDPNKETQNVNLFNSSVPFPVDFESNQSPPFPNPALSSSLPNTFYTNSRLSVPLVQNVNGEISNNPFHTQELNNNPSHSKLLKSRASEPIFNFVPPQNGHVVSQNVINTTYLGTSPPPSTILGPTQQLTVNTNVQLISQNSSSSPIPIPPRQTNFTKDRSFSSCSTESPYSKSPIPYNSDSPNHADYYQQIQTDNYSPNGLILKNGSLTPNQYSNGENLPTISPPSYNASRQNTNLHNGVCRPRPRPNLSKGSSVPSSGHSNSSQSVSSDSSSDYEAISRENMQSIANVLLTSGHRLRAQSLCFETNNEYNMNGDKTIFAKKNDPFADDFFFSLPKKANHLVNNEIPEYV